MTDGRIVYPVATGIPTTSLNDFSYHQSYSEFDTGLAFRDVSVNPTLYGVNLNRENGTSSNSFVNSMVCTEIRNTSYGGSISNDSPTTIGNRILPINSTLDSYATNHLTTSSHKIKTFDGGTASETNRKFLYSTSNYPSTGEVGLDIDNYDYFILLNPEIITVGTDTIRPHFAKIERIISFDMFGDGLEFYPKYPTSIPVGTNFEIFKGPAKTDTSVVAVSYGLRGDNASSTDKYDVVNTVSLPTFYFYEDRLDTPNQLDYHEKYTLTSFRWWSSPYIIALATTVGGYAQFNRGTTSKYFTISNTNYAKVEEGMSLFTNNNVHVGNIEKKYGSAGSYKIYLDFARVAISATSSSVNYKIGRTAQNIVFMTESKFNNTITNIGMQKIDATLVDEYLNEDIAHTNYVDAYTDTGNNNSVNPTRWQYIFPNAKRSTVDIRWGTFPTSSSLIETTLDGNLTGPNKYITFEKSQYENDRIPFVHSVILNKTHNQISQLGRVTVLDSAGLSHKTLKEDNVLSLRNAIYNDSLVLKELDGHVSKTSSTLITMTFDKENGDLQSFLGNQDIVQINRYHYVINSINNKSNNTQTFRVIANKLITANTWTVNTSIHEFDKQKMFTTPITRNAYVNYTFEADTAVNHLRNNLVTINGFSSTKVKSRMYGTRMVSNSFPKNLNEIEFADKNNRYAKILDVNRKLYQPTTISRLYYYSGAYAITEEVFTGRIEDITSTQENGLMSYEILGRDDTSKFITDVTNSNLSTSTDIIYASIPPKTEFTTIGTTSVSISGSTLTLSGVTAGTHVPRKYWLYVDSNGNLIGEVLSQSTSGTTITITLSHPALVTSASNVKYFRPLEDGNYISTLKTLSHNKLLTDSVSDSSSFIEQGLVFEKGFTYNYRATTDAANSNTGSTPTPSNLFNSSNTGSVDVDGTLGYDINSPIRAGINDSHYAFKLGDENGISITNNNISTQNAETFNIVDINTKEENETIIYIAPNFPMVLGRIENNTLDSRTTRSVYLINNNINNGGFLHRLTDTHTNQYTPKDTIRFWDIQKFTEGTLTQTQTSIYNQGKTQQKIQGYGIASGIRADGTLYDVAVSLTNSPINGSNTLDGWNYLNTFYGHAQNKLIKSYPYQVGSNWYEADIDYDAFKQIDPRTVPLELFVTGDIYPNSQLRWNHMFHFSELYNAHPFSDYGLLLESKHNTSDIVTNHLNYTGSTQQTVITENEFESMTIKSSPHSASSMKRWGVIRLVEATYDWHFNPVEFDALKESKDIPTLPYFDYIMMDKPSLETASDDVVLGNSSSNVRLSSDDIGTGTLGGDVYYTTDFIGVNTSETVAIENAVKINGFLGVKQHGTWSGTATDQQWNGNSSNHNGSTTSFNNVLTFQGYDDTSAVGYYGVKNFPLFRNTNFLIDKLSTPTLSSANSLRTARITGSHNIRFTDVILPSPMTSLTNFTYGGKLRDGSQGSDNAFDGHNIILPIIPRAYNGGNANNTLGRRFSPFHHPDSWYGQDTNFLHTSRVIAALVDRTFNAGSNITIADKYGLGITSNGASQGIAHLYDNCIGVFKDVQLAVTGSKGRKPNINVNSIMSSPLELDTVSRYDAYEAGLSSDVNESQHTRNLMIDDKDTDKAMIGTKSSGIHFLEGTFDDLSPEFAKNNAKIDTGGNLNSNFGTVASAQFIVKPMFDLTAVSSTLVFSNNNKTVTFTHSAVSKHIWLSFVPNLKGQYIVSEKLNGGNTIRTQSLDGSPLFIAKILSHTVSVAPSTSALETHVITFDTAINVSTNGTKYRVMKISETTFNEVKEKIEFNVLNNNLVNFADFKFGKGVSDDGDFSRVETVYDMYLLLDVDTINTYIERRTIDTVNDSFTNGEVLDVYVTDGVTSSRHNMTVNTNRDTIGRDTEVGLSFKFGDVLNGNGVVSFSKVVRLTLEGRPKLKEIEKCHIGSTFKIGTNIDTFLEKIVSDAGLNFDHDNSFITETGNIFEVQGNNGSLGIHVLKLNCYEAVSNIVVGDILYTHTGYLVGKVTAIGNGNNTANQSVTGNRITVEKLFYTPQFGDEFVTVNQKTFISTLNFQNLDTLSALNVLSSTKDLEYSINNGKVTTRNISDTKKLRKFSINYRDSERLISVENNVSMFDKANKVIVIGDRVTYTAEIPHKGNTKVIKHISPSIKTKSEAQLKANKILTTHNSDSRKINLKIQKKGLELLTAGDIINLNFPEQNIPNADYRVFEIENVLSGVLEITVGTFNKSIAERLTEINLQQKEDAISTSSKDSINTTTGKYLFDAININQISFGYTISTPTGASSNLGIGDSMGILETIGIQTGTEIIKTYNEEYYEQ